MWQRRTPIVQEPRGLPAGLGQRAPESVAACAANRKAVRLLRHPILQQWSECHDDYEELASGAPSPASTRSDVRTRIGSAAIAPEPGSSQPIWTRDQPPCVICKPWLRHLQSSADAHIPDTDVGCHGQPAVCSREDPQHDLALGIAGGMRCRAAALPQRGQHVRFVAGVAVPGTHS